MSHLSSMKPPGTTEYTMATTRPNIISARAAADLGTDAMDMQDIARAMVRAERGNPGSWLPFDGAAAAERLGCEEPTAQALCDLMLTQMMAEDEDESTDAILASWPQVDGGCRYLIGDVDDLDDARQGPARAERLPGVVIEEESDGRLSAPRGLPDGWTWDRVRAALFSGDE